jgi:hypothetical protein
MVSGGGKRGEEGQQKNKNLTQKNVLVSHDLLLGTDPQNELLYHAAAPANL